MSIPAAIPMKPEGEGGRGGVYPGWNTVLAMADYKSINNLHFSQRQMRTADKHDRVERACHCELEDRLGTRPSLRPKADKGQVN